MFDVGFKIFAFIITSVILTLAATPTNAQTKTQSDNYYAVLYAYFSIGDDSAPSYNVTKDQFLGHIDELKKGHYTIKPLPEIIASFKAQKKLPQKTIGLTFDGADKSIIDVAAPILISQKIPFTIFIPSQKISDSDNPTLMSWDDLKDLNDTGLVTFGLHPSSYARLTNASAEDIKRQINNSLFDVRKKLGVEPKLFAYPFGEYNEKYEHIVKGMGFDAAFGQQSGVAYAGSDLYSLPRFTLTENYADLDRFIMSANALPFPATDISPPSPFLNSVSPSIGFTLPEEFSSKDKKAMKCFSSTGEKPSISFLENRVEIRLKDLNDSRPRLNCTIPYETTDGEEDTRWRWIGFLFSNPQDEL